MIKKITGILFATAVVLVIAMTVMHRGEYSSLLFNGQEAETDTEQAETTGNPTETASTDEVAPDEIGETAETEMAEAPEA